jgi:integrase
MLTELKLKSLTDAGRYPVGGAVGCYLQVTVGISGQINRSFFYRYKFNGRTREAGLGAYPATSLADARAKAKDAASIKARGIDPLAEKSRAKANASIAHATFEQASDALLKHLCEQRADSKFPIRTARQWRAGFENHVFPKIGKIDVCELRHAHIAGLLAPLANGKGKTKREAKGGPTVAQRLRPRIERVIDFACAHGFRDPDQVNPARIELLRDVLGKQPAVTHHAAAPLDQVPGIYQRLAQETDTINNAIRFLILTACRLREVLDARFDELDLEARTFAIPPHRSKTGTPHIVPLSDAAMAIVEAQLSRRCSSYVFPGRFGSPLATSTCAPALKRIGITNTTLHGFRSSFRDWASEIGGIDDNVAELSLNHKVGNAVQQAYFRTTLFDKRKVAMSAWSDWLAGREPALNVVQLRRDGAGATLPG